MKKILMITLLFAISSLLYAPGFTAIYIVRSEVINPALVLWMAVKIVEASNNPDTINYDEGAYGCGQIRQIMLDEYNRLTGEHITLQDCLLESVSKKIFLWHCCRYADLETAAKRWNGSGPATEIYWGKVKRYLK